MGFDVQTDLTRRKGPGLFTFVAVAVILFIQIGVLVVFQYVQRGDEGRMEDLVATVHVQERETTVSEVDRQVAENNGRPDEQVLPVEQKHPQKDTGVVRDSEEDLVNLLRDIEADANEPPPEEPEGVAGSDGIFSALTGREHETEMPDINVEKRPKQVRMARRPVVVAKEKKIRIVSVEQNRFPASAESDEMRILNISLTGMKDEQNIDGGDVALKVTFYDEVGDSGMTIPSRVQTSLNPIRLKNRRWKPNATYMVTATYMVPKGFRDDYRAKTGARMKYYGYIVELYYDGDLQDLRAQPKKLLTHIR